MRLPPRSSLIVPVRGPPPPSVSVWRPADGALSHLHLCELVGSQSLAGRAAGTLGPFEAERRAAGAQLLAFSRVLSEVAGRAEGGKPNAPKVTPVRDAARPAAAALPPRLGSHTSRRRGLSDVKCKKITTPAGEGLAADADAGSAPVRGLADVPPGHGVPGGRGLPRADPATPAPQSLH